MLLLTSDGMIKITHKKYIEHVKYDRLRFSVIPHAAVTLFMWRITSDLFMYTAFLEKCLMNEMLNPVGCPDMNDQNLP